MVGQSTPEVAPIPGVGGSGSLSAANLAYHFPPQGPCTRSDSRPSSPLAPAVQHDLAAYAWSSVPTWVAQQQEQQQQVGSHHHHHPAMEWTQPSSCSSAADTLNREFSDMAVRHHYHHQHQPGEQDWDCPMPHHGCGASSDRCAPNNTNVAPAGFGAPPPCEFPPPVTSIGTPEAAPLPLASGTFLRGSRSEPTLLGFGDEGLAGQAAIVEPYDKRPEHQHHHRRHAATEASPFAVPTASAPSTADYANVYSSDDEKVSCFLLFFPFTPLDCPWQRVRAFLLPISAAPCRALGKLWLVCKHAHPARMA